MDTKNNSLPTISVLIPTLNSQRVLGKCLSSIRKQDYPKNKIKIIITDGGSTDKTRKIAKDYKAKLFDNPLKTGEAGKAVALRHAKSDLVALIDSDNYLPDKNWLKKMVAPFADPEILGSEPWKFTYRKDDSLVNRYCALIGMNDPYCYFVGNYDRYSYLSSKWTGLKLEQKDKGGYLKVKIAGKILPTIGANGTMWQTQVLKKAVGKNDFLFDTDIPYTLSKNNPFYFAKVKVGIVHDFCPTIKDYIRKQKRRINDFYYLEKSNIRSQTYQHYLQNKIQFSISTILALPLVFQTIKGYIYKQDSSWLFHLPACFLTLWIYGSGTIMARLKKTQIKRDQWKQ